MPTGFSREIVKPAFEFGEPEPPRFVSPGPPQLRHDLGQNLRYVARQPILDAHGKLHGYELLFRSGPTAVAFSGDGNAATRTVLDNAVTFGLDKLTGGLPMFVNCTEEALLDSLVMVLPPRHTVLEVLETINPSPALFDVCRELKTLGYGIALDDFELRAVWEPMLEFADYVKVDLSRTTREQRTALVSKMRGLPAKLVLERVETPEDLELGRNEGFTLYQGYYFCRPVLIENRAIPANQIIHLDMLRALHKEPLDVKRVASLVKRDASLTYRLLRMVNSPFYAMRKVVSSIEGALVLIGDEMFRRVATLAIACELNGRLPSELVQMAFIRARFCELAAPLLRQDTTEQYLVGILSLFPAMLGVPMSAIANAMPFRAEVRRALLGEANAVRTALEWLELYEQGMWNECERVALIAGFSDTTLPQIYTDSLLWAEATLRTSSTSNGETQSKKSL
jgi:EAL and modified HD-GYP domain-containing signal transduction protein